jgi:intein/homing endonuclease
MERYEFDREIGKLSEGDILKDIELNEVSVVSIKELDREKTQTYIFHVEDNQNFFANELLTHNKPSGMT